MTEVDKQLEELARIRSNLRHLLQSINVRRMATDDDVANLNRQLDRLAQLGFNVEEWKTSSSELYGGGVHYTPGGVSETMPRQMNFQRFGQRLGPTIEFTERQIRWFSERQTTNRQDVAAVKSAQEQLWQTLVDAYLKTQEPFRGVAADGVVTIYHPGLNDGALVPNWEHIMALGDQQRLHVRETKRGQWQVRISSSALEQYAGEDPKVTITSHTNPAEVWVIHGRNDTFRKEVFDLLRRVQLRPIEFNQAVLRSGSGSPIVLDVVLKEIRNAPAIVALLSDDEQAELRKELWKDPNDLETREAGFQPRPNVILETGMALAAMRDRTIVVTKGNLREISDIKGIHDVRAWDDSVFKRKDLVDRLQSLGSPVNTTGNDWLT